MNQSLVAAKTLQKVCITHRIPRAREQQGRNKRKKQARIISKRAV